MTHRAWEVEPGRRESREGDPPVKVAGRDYKVFPAGNHRPHSGYTENWQVCDLVLTKMGSSKEEGQLEPLEIHAAGRHPSVSTWACAPPSLAKAGERAFQDLIQLSDGAWGMCPSPLYLRTLLHS